MPEIVFRFNTPPTKEDYRNLAKSLMRLKIFVAPSADRVGELVPIVELDTIFPDIGDEPDPIQKEEMVDNGELIRLTVNYSQHSYLKDCLWLDLYTNGTCKWHRTIEEKNTPVTTGSWEEGIQEMLSYLSKLVPESGQRTIQVISKAIQSNIAHHL